MKIVKTVLRNRIGDDFMNHCIISFLDQRLLYSTPRKDVIDCFLKMRDRRGQKKMGRNYFCNLTLFSYYILTKKSYLCEFAKKNTL